MTSGADVVLACYDGACIISYRTRKVVSRTARIGGVTLIGFVPRPRSNNADRSLENTTLHKRMHACAVGACDAVEGTSVLNVDCKREVTATLQHNL